MEIKYVFTDEEEETEPIKKRGRGRPKGSNGNGKRTGRPSKKDTLDLGMIETLYGYGLTDEQLAKALDVSIQTITNWKKDEEFLLSLKKGKEISDNRVERSLYERATGYDCVETDIRVIDKEIVTTQILRHYPPDTTAQIFWLKNRKKAEWRDKQEVGLTDGNGGPITFKVVYENRPLQIEDKQEGIK